MLLDAYHSAQDDYCRVSAEQGSHFAKGVAGDFNPLHDADNSRFCVPGDLLFALVLTRQGLSRVMRFGFEGMASAGAPLHIPARATPGSVLTTGDKTLVRVTRDGETTTDQHIIERVVSRYVAFSGQNFPHILVPLMEGHGVMINPERPLVIYECMSFELRSLEIAQSPGTALDLTLLDSTLESDGKRAKAQLRFEWRLGAECVGSGTKTLILGGLRPFEPVGLQGLVDRYDGWRARYMGHDADAHRIASSCRVAQRHDL
jgi:hypothetical protein